jgi:hypothetical protein
MDETLLLWRSNSLKIVLISLLILLVINLVEGLVKSMGIIVLT